LNGLICESEKLLGLVEEQPNVAIKQLTADSRQIQPLFMSEHPCQRETAEAPSHGPRNPAS